MNNKRGFTLIELVIVIAVLSILALIAIPRYSGILSRNRENACIANRQIIIKHFYTCNEYKEGLSFEDFFNNPEECFNSDLNCPAGGEYSLEGNYLVSSKHGKTFINISTGAVFYLDFSDENFDTSLLDNIITNTDSEDWDVELVNGSYVFTNDGGGGEKRVYFENSYNQYSLTSNIQLDDFSYEDNPNLNGYGVMFETVTNENGVDSGYIFQFDAGYGDGEFVFRTRTDGNEVSPFMTIDPSDVINDYNSETFWSEQHEFKIDVEKVNSTEKIFRVYVDGYEITKDENLEDITINSLQEEEDGYIGFRTWGGDNALVSDLKVEPIN